MLTDSWMDETKLHFGYEYLRPLLLKASTAKSWATTITVDQMREADVIIISYAGLRIVYETMRTELRSHMNANIDKYHYYFEDLDSDNLEKISERIKKITQTFEIGFRTIWSNPDTWTAKHFLFGYAWSSLMSARTLRTRQPRTSSLFAASTQNASGHSRAHPWRTDPTNCTRSSLSLAWQIHHH